MVIAKLRHLHIAPRKVRLVADLIRGKRVEEAQTILNFTTKKAAQPLLKLLNSAAASAQNNFQLDPANLYISKITVDEGPKFKRWMPRARGQASEIQKKTSHVAIVLDGINGKFRRVKEAKKVKKVEKTERISGPTKPRPKSEKEIKKPKTEKGIRRIFRRKAF